eukprot:TRINITY_DN10181_c0_g1_i1.p1 TRINITY_DN10181_c0_g1~~TRINITY_DN10181_c0_g1_i1.p1  ORF type:complete len:435 (-),score=132.76 TRINITY_DN10181_c0_g1_i1:27-1331(-)
MKQERLFLLFTIFISLSISAEVVAVGDLQDTRFRAFTVAAVPSFDEIYAFGANGAALDWTNETSQESGEATLDAAAFRHVVPGFVDGANKSATAVGYYFGYFTASAEWDVGAGTGNIEAASLEVLVASTNLWAWMDYDGEDGFQFELGNDVWDCESGEANGHDCIIADSTIEFSDVTFSPATYEVMDCPDTEVYSTECKIFNLVTTSDAPYENLITFTFKFASQPVMVDGVEVTQDQGKIDIEINYPWDEFNFDESAKVGLTNIAAGKAASFEATSVENVSGSTGVTYEYENKKSFFSWDDKATVGVTDSQVYWSVITGQDIADFDCFAENCGYTEAIFIGALKIYVGIYDVFGWQTQFIFFSWKENQPDTVFWDPRIGTEDSEKLEDNAEDEADVADVADEADEADSNGNDEADAFAPKVICSFVVLAALSLF